MFLINEFLNDAVICNLQDWGIGRPRLVWSPESCFAAAQCCCARVVRWKVKVVRSLTECLAATVFEQQDITVICTIHFHRWLHEKRTSAPEPGNTDWNRHAGTCLSETIVKDVHELKQHLVSSHPTCIRRWPEFRHDITMRKTRTVRLPDGEDRFTRFNRIHERDGKTDIAQSDNPWKLIFSTTILIDSVSLLFCTFIGFLQFRHRTRFRDSLCLGSVFKCLFTYLLTMA